MHAGWVGVLWCVLSAGATEPLETDDAEASERQGDGSVQSFRSSVPRGQELPDLAPLEPQDEGIWTWVDRFEGEVLPAGAREEQRSFGEARHEGRAVFGELGSLDLALDVYEDPAGAVRGDALHLDLIDPRDFDLPISTHPAVQEWIAHMVGPGRRYFQKWLERKGRYEELIFAAMDEAGAPRDLIYLAMIESGYSSYATSHAGAGGLWQFIPSTARMYDLRVDWWLDERRDPELATAAAATMLTRLHAMFGDWYLAMAAYNTGPGRVRRQLSKTGSKTYWDLRDGGHLHRETMGYVPKIVAAMIVGHYAERYGFTDLEPQAPLRTDGVDWTSSRDVAQLAEAAGLSEDEFRDLNPALRRFATPDGPVVLRVPRGTAEAFVTAVEKLPAVERRLVEHVVASGESLSKIAARYEVPVEAIVTANGLKSAHRIRVGQVLVLPVDGPVVTRAPTAVATKTTAAASTSRSSAAPPPEKPTTHRVVSGDAISRLAERYDISESDLRRWNHLTSDVIRVGQVLKLTGGASEVPSTGAPSEVRHTVVSGDTLSEIASAYGVSTSDLASWNGLQRDGTLRVGQRLVIKGTAQRWTEHVVKPGESLGAIARRRGCSVADLQEWNQISGTTIYPGQSLRILRK